MSFFDAIAIFCFGYPFVMAFYWIAGGVLYYWLRERHEPRPDAPPRLAHYPPVSVLVPCYNEERQLAETFGALVRIDYPDFEVIAIDDGSSDLTGAMLDALTEQMPQLRVVHLDSNQGKSTALNTGALAARHELLVCIDGDAMLDPHALTWFVRRFQSDPKLGALTGNPRIRNRATLLGRLQVGEFSSIVGLIKRAQTVYGQLFSVSGVICAFRKRGLHDAGWWARDAITEDVDVSWRIQLAGWHIAFVPKALCWILMPETLHGLWRQRLRWSEGGTSTMIKVFPQLWSAPSRWHLIPVWVNFVAAVAWSYAIIFGMLVWGAQAGWTALGYVTTDKWPAFSPIPQVWGTVLGLTYLLQAVLSMAIDQRYERGLLGALFWVVWYPLVFWGLQAMTSIVGLPLALVRGRPLRGTWTSPDRGVPMKPLVQLASTRWPPLIPSSHAPWPVRVRDVLLTVMAWLVLIWLMHDLLLILVAELNRPVAESVGSWIDHHLEPLLGHVVLPSPSAFWDEFQPYVYAAGAFVAWLIFWGWWNREKLRRQAPVAGSVYVPNNDAPPALPMLQQFVDAGVSEPLVPLWWHRSRRLHVRFDGHGRVAGAIGSDP